MKKWGVVWSSSASEPVDGGNSEVGSLKQEMRLILTVLVSTSKYGW